jgi:hypothetical protein
VTIFAKTFIMNEDKRIKTNEEFNPSRWILIDEAEEMLVATISRIYDEVHNKKYEYE